MQQPFNKTDGTLYVWSPSAKKTVPATFRYMPGSEFALYPEFIHPDDQDKFKTRFAQSVATIATSMGYSNVKVDYGYNTQPGSVVGMFAFLTANGKNSSPMAVPMLAYYYNTETNTDGTSGQIYMIVSAAINLLFQS